MHFCSEIILDKDKHVLSISANINYTCSGSLCNKRNYYFQECNFLAGWGAVFILDNPVHKCTLMTTELNKYSDEHTDFRIMIILYVVEIK